MHALRQIRAITWISLSTIPQRLASSLVIVVGIAGVVGVLVALLAMSEGFSATLKATGRTDQAIVLRAAATSELSSGLTRDDVQVITHEPQVLRDPNGNPVASAEVVVITNLPKKTTGTPANVEVRGVGPEAWTLRSNVKIVKGRRFTPGLQEIIAGGKAADQFKGLSVGSEVNLNNQRWKVVGIFSSGDANESDLWGDVDVIQSAYKRTSYQSVTVKLTDPSALGAFKKALGSDPRLNVDAQTTRKYYATQSQRLRKVIGILATVVAVIMAIGATFGALNTMYAAVSSRIREIATLRAIGFSGGPVVVSVLLESLLLALLGGVVGAAIAWAIFDKYTVSTLGSNFTQVVFAFKVSPSLILGALRWALVIGLVGGLFPAIRAARMPVTTALREL